MKLPVLFLCLAATSAFANEPLPGGGVAKFEKGPAREARYVMPTKRYDHGVLGDAVEAGGLELRSADGVVKIFALDESMVFEDITPRMADLDGDGIAEIITIVSSLTEGSALAVFKFDGQLLKLAGQTPFIGRTHRWLNVISVGDFSGAGKTDIAIVVTPHIGGPLQIWRYENSSLKLVHSEGRYSNHAVGSTAMGLAEIADVNGDAVPDVIVPKAGRRAVQVITFKDDRPHILKDITLPGAVAGKFQRLDNGIYAVLLEDGSNFILELK